MPTICRAEPSAISRNPAHALGWKPALRSFIRVPLPVSSRRTKLTAPSAVNAKPTTTNHFQQGMEAPYCPHPEGVAEASLTVIGAAFRVNPEQWRPSSHA